MQDKHIDEKIDNILDTELSTTIRFQKGEAVGVTIYGLDRAKQQIKTLITTEQLAIWNKALELLENKEVKIMEGTGENTEWYTKGINDGWNAATNNYRSAIQQQIDEIGGKE